MKKTRAKDGLLETIFINILFEKTQKWNSNDIRYPLIEGICQPDSYYHVILIRTVW